MLFPQNQPNGGNIDLNLRKAHKRSCFMFQMVFLSKKQRGYGEAEVTIQFHLDGYESQETSKTQIVDPPYIDSRRDSEPFVPYPPCSDKFIHIKVLVYMSIYTFKEL